MTPTDTRRGSSKIGWKAFSIFPPKVSKTWLGVWSVTENVTAHMKLFTNVAQERSTVCRNGDSENKSWLASLALWKERRRLEPKWGTIPDPRSPRTRLKVRLIRKHISCHSLAPSCKRRMRFILVREYVLEFVSARKSMLSPNKPGRVWAKQHLISRFDFYRSIFPDKRPHCLPSE